MFSRLGRKAAIASTAARDPVMKSAWVAQGLSPVSSHSSQYLFGDRLQLQVGRPFVDLTDLRVAI